ncbi:MAG: hypothetical protein QME40_08050, partial [bacterium]|nr:hypothetical protein [bacterium]
FLLRHPALVAFIGFHLKGYHPHFGFDPEVTVPTSRHLRRRLQEIQNRHLKLLLYNTVRSLKELGLVNDEVIMDTTEIIARVKENNPKQFVSNRYNKNKIPNGNPDSRLGIKPSTNKSKDGKTKLRYFWGFKNGAAFQETKHGIITLNEETKAANTADVNFFFPLIKPIKDTLRITIKTFIADAAFDAWYVYHFVTKGKGTAFIPINTRGHKILQHGYGPNGRPLCPDNREMANAGTWFDKKRGYRRQKYICPLIDPHTGKRKQNQTCRCDHPKWQKKGCYKYINLDDPENSRFAIDRESCLFKRTYKKRTIAERGFSIIKNYKLEDPIFRNEDSIANLYTIAYSLMNAKVILKAKEESLPQEEALLQETAA